MDASAKGELLHVGPLITGEFELPACLHEFIAHLGDTHAIFLVLAGEDVELVPGRGGVVGALEVEVLTQRSDKNVVFDRHPHRGERNQQALIDDTVFREHARTRGVIGGFGTNATHSADPVPHHSHSPVKA